MANTPQPKKLGINVVFAIAAVIAMPLLGFALMRVLTVIPMSETSTGNHYLFTVLIYLLGLAIPFFMLKLLFHAAHLRNPEEKQMHLADIPANKDDLAVTLKSRQH